MIFIDTMPKTKFFYAVDNFNVNNVLRLIYISIYPIFLTYCFRFSCIDNFGNVLIYPMPNKIGTETRLSLEIKTTLFMSLNLWVLASPSNLASN